MATLMPEAPNSDPEQQEPPSTKEEQPYVEVARERHTGLKVLAALVVFGVLFAVFKDRQTLDLGFQETNGFQDWLNRVRDWVQLSGPDNWFFGGVLGGIGSAFNAVVTFLQETFSIAAFPRPVPRIGWLGVVVLTAWVTWALAGIRSTILVAVSLMLFGIAGFYSDSIDLLIITGVAVFVCVLVGLPIGIAMARRARVSAAITPLLDGMQTLPAFAYLAPFALLFGIGAPAAVIITVIYAVPPLVRIAELGIRQVPEATVEAARSMGLTSTQMLRRVELPIARRTIVVGDQPVHAGGALDRHHRLAGQRPRSRQAGAGGPAVAEHRPGGGARPRHRADGDHARPDHHRDQRALPERGPLIGGHPRSSRPGGSGAGSPAPLGRRDAGPRCGVGRGSRQPDAGSFGVCFWCRWPSRSISRAPTSAWPGSRPVSSGRSSSRSTGRR